MVSQRFIEQVVRGFSCDLHILEANSYGKPEAPTFYDQLKSGSNYTGKYAEVMLEIGDVYENIKKIT